MILGLKAELSGRVEKLAQVVLAYVMVLVIHDSWMNSASISHDTPMCEWPGCRKGLKAQDALQDHVRHTFLHIYR